jgi:HK97 family phage portal protein
MGVLSIALARPTEKRRAGVLGGEWLGMGGGLSAAGIQVTEEGSLRYAAVFACVRVIAEAVASLPLLTYERVGERGKTRARAHPLYELLHDAPNPLMTSLEWREAMQAHLLLWGNGYSEIELDGSGRVVALWPLRPDGMEKIEPAGEGLVYTYRLPSGGAAKLMSWQVLHLRGLSSNGIVGYSPIQLAAKESIGRGLAIQRYGSMFFRNGARPGGVLTFPGELSQEAIERLREGWQAKYGGLENAQRVAVLEAGMTYQEVGIPPGDAAYIEDQKMSALDVARVFKVPPHMIGDLDRATFANIEHQSLEFVMHSLRPWLVRWEQALEQRLMTAAERERMFVKFNVDGLLRGDTLSRYQAYAIGRQNGFMSANDIRELEDWNPVEGGDEYLVPLNMIPAGEAGQAGEAQAGEGQRAKEDTRYEIRDTKDENRARENNGRVRLMRANRAVFEEAMGRVVRRQAQDVEAAARKMMKRATPEQRDAEGDFRLWLEAFWSQHREWIVKTLRPLYQSYGATAALAAMREVGGNPDLVDVEQFMADYVDEFADFLTGKSRTKIEAALEEEDAPAAVAAAVGAWSAWPESLALRETVSAANAVSTEVYRKQGIQELVWHTTWGDRSCAYCEGLDGVIVGIDSKFDVPGLPPFRNVAYPPAHDGCECVVVARV